LVRTFSPVRILQNQTFASVLLSWYQENKRDLPWRSTTDPYKIWLSEIILQQTRVAQGMPYYLTFLENFPNVLALAEATEQQVLRLWQGLGYYSRARNLHRCAHVIRDKYKCSFPENYQELLALPGIGEYTAAAIASFAFKQPTPVVDGNVFRVLSRVFGVQDDIAASKTRKIFHKLSARLMNGSPPELYNQAIMEFGALYCTPAQPKCLSCPFSGYCQAYLTQTQDKLPVKTKRTAIRNRHFYYYVVKSGTCLLMKKRERKDIWQGLYDFFLVEHQGEIEPIQLLANSVPDGSWLEKIQISEPSMTYKHKLTHQLINARFTVINATDNQTLSVWKQVFGLEEFELPEVVNLPKPILINNYLKEDIF